MDKSTTLKQLLIMKSECNLHKNCDTCRCRRTGCEKYKGLTDVEPFSWKLPTNADPELTLEELAKAREICSNCEEGCSHYHPYDDDSVTETCPLRRNNCCQFENDDELLPSDWVLPKCDVSNTILRDFDTLREPETVKLVGLAGVSTEDLLKELERRQVSPEMMTQFAIERKAAQFKKKHLDVIKAAVTIHNYCESTAEVRENDCRSCFLYNRLKDGCGVNWSEKDLDDTILELCKDGTII